MRFLALRIGSKVSPDPDSELELKLATEIAVAFLTRNAIERTHIGELIGEIRMALRSPVAAGQAVTRAVPSPMKEAVESRQEAAPVRLDLVEPPAQAPAVSISESVHDDYLISLEDGKPYRSLKRHLMAKHGLTPEDYRKKWGLPPDYPMVAPSYARDRSEVAKRIGLGRVQTARSSSAPER